MGNSHNNVGNEYGTHNARIFTFDAVGWPSAMDGQCSITDLGLRSLAAVKAFHRFALDDSLVRRLILLVLSLSQCCRVFQPVRPSLTFITNSTITRTVDFSPVYCYWVVPAPLVDPYRVTFVIRNKKWPFKTQIELTSIFSKNWASAAIFLTHNFQSIFLYDSLEFETYSI